MRKLVAVEFLSLDGVMETPGSPDEDREGGFEHGGWAQPYAVARYRPTAPGDDPFAAHPNSTPKYVASRTLQSLAWENSTLIEGDVAAAVGELKQQAGKNIAVLGSGDSKATSTGALILTYQPA